MTSPDTLGGLYKALCAELDERTARLVLAKQTGCTWADILADPGWAISPALAAKINRDKERCRAGEPVSRLYGAREFYGLNFKLSPATLDPRPETEMIVDLARGRFDPGETLNILDLGTGSGCLLGALLHHFPHSYGVGIDISFEALGIAGANAASLGCGERAAFVAADWGDPLAGSFDLIVANPPYIAAPDMAGLPDNVKKYDPSRALNGGADGLDAYKRILPQIPVLLKTGGIALCEIGYNQKENVVRLARNSGLSIKHVHPDYARWPRVVEISNGDK